MKSQWAALALVVAGTAAASTPGVPPYIVTLGKQNTPLFEAGYLDATLYDGWNGHRVDPLGVTDSTKALQQVIADARDYNLIAYLPSGTYLISDTLTGESLDGSGQNISCLDHTNYGTPYSAPKAATLVGPGTGTRPLLKLAKNASGFQSAASSRPMVHFWLQDKYSKGYLGDAACLMWGAIRDVDFDLGGNPGAVGVEFGAAQFSYLENVKVNATGAYAGVMGVPSTNPTVNIEVEGGQYGIIPATCCGITLAGVTLKDQTVAALQLNNFSSVVVSGFDISSSVGGVGVLNSGFASQTSEIALIDGKIEITGSTTQPAISNPNGHDLYVSNVYVKTPGSLLKSGTETAIASSGQFDLIEEYSFSDQHTYTNSGYTAQASENLINGVIGHNTISTYQLRSATPPTDLVIRHLPGPLPWAFASGTLNVKSVGAYGDGVHDDTAAIQKAINQSDVVFLPRGDYQLTATLQLKANTRIFGLPGQRSRLRGANFTPNGVFKPYIATVDSATAKTYVGDLDFELPGATVDQTYLNALEWKAGKSSVLHQVGVNLPWTNGDTTSEARKLVHASGHAGGKWYGLTESLENSRTSNAGFRMLLVENTTQPLTMYQPNPEHAGAPEYEFSGASNVRILGTKTETGYLALIANSHNVMLAGHSGHDGVKSGNQSIEVKDSQNVVVPIAAFFVDSATAAERAGFNVGYSNNGAAEAGVHATSQCSLFKEGTFDASVFNHCGDGVCDGAENHTNCSHDCTSTGGSSTGGGAGGGGGSTGGSGGGGGTTSSRPSWTACEVSNSFTIDGQNTEWSSVPALNLPHTDAKVIADAPDLPSSDADLSAKVQLAWNATYLYALVTVTDDHIEDPSTVILPYVDGTELYLDGTHSRASTYDAHDFQLTVSESNRSDATVSASAKDVHATHRTSTGYQVEYAIPWSSLGGRKGTIGFDLGVNDNDNGTSRSSQLVWAGNGTAWKDPTQFGDLVISTEACGTAGTSNPLGADENSEVAGGCSATGGGTLVTLALLALMMMRRSRRAQF